MIYIIPLRQALTGTRHGYATAGMSLLQRALHLEVCNNSIGFNARMPPGIQLNSRCLHQDARNSNLGVRI